MSSFAKTARAARAMAPAWISCTDAARKAEVSPETIQRWGKIGWIVAHRVGGRWRIDPASLDRLLAGNRPDQKP